MDLLNHPDIWIGDTGASNFSSKFSHGATNKKESTTVTIGHSGGETKGDFEADLPVTHCTKYGEEVCDLTLTSVNIDSKSNYNLFSISRMLDVGFKMEGDDEAIVLRRGDAEIRFDIKIETKNGALFCAYFKRRIEDDTEVNAGAAGSAVLEMSVNQAHQRLGHPSEQTTRATAAELG